jgi:hypothetical protein
VKQRAYIKFCFKLGKSAAETFQIIQTVYGNKVISWKTFLSSIQDFVMVESTGDDSRPGPSLTV